MKKIVIIFVTLLYCSFISSAQNNPIGRIDPTEASDEPVFSSTGDHRGDTEEGYKGQVIIYDGDRDFTKMKKDELIKILRMMKRKQKLMIRLGTICQAKPEVKYGHIYLLS